MSDVSLFQGVKWQGLGVDHPLPTNAEVKERVELYVFPSASWPLLGWNVKFTLYFTCNVCHKNSVKFSLLQCSLDFVIVYVFTKKYSFPPRKIYFNIILQDFECGPVPWTFSDLGLCLVIFHLHCVRIWLRHCTTSRKTAGWIPDGVIGFFHWHNPSGRTLPLRSIQPQQEWIFPQGKDGRCVGLTTVPPSYADCLEIWEPQPPGTLRACPGL